MPTILHIETATEICSICISQGPNILSIRESVGHIHAAQITLLIQDLMESANVSFSELDAVSLSRGPGSYTSLRVGTSAAKGICYAQGIPLIAVDTLQSLALAAIQKEKINVPTYSIPLIDARRMEVYTAVFDEHNNSVEPTHAKIITDGAFSTLLSSGHTILFSGNGLGKCKQHLQHPQMIYSNVVCSARHLVKLALDAHLRKTFVDTAYFSPYYFKSPNITLSKKKIL